MYVYNASVGGGRGSLVAEALCYKPEGRVFYYQRGHVIVQIT
jgi:hypothetical protein